MQIETVEPVEMLTGGGEANRGHAIVGGPNLAATIAANYVVTFAEARRLSSTGYLLGPGCKSEETDG